MSIRLSHRSSRAALTLAALLACGLGLPAHAATAAECPAGHNAVGQRPPAGNEWKCIDAKGDIDGPWLTWYANGQLMSERQMKRGREHGRQRSWWPNGQLMMEGVSVEGHRYQGFKYWTIDGQPTQLEVETETVTQKLDDQAVQPKHPTTPPSQGEQRR